MSIEAGKEVVLYRNRHQEVWSILDPKTRRVIAYSGSLVLEKVTFTVSQAGRARVLKTGRRNVHAFARGIVSKRHLGPVVSGRYTRVRYNPFTHDSFRYKGRLIAKGSMVAFCLSGTVLLMRK